MKGLSIFLGGVLALASLADARAPVQEGSLLGRVREMERDLGGRKLSPALPERTPKKWWYQNEAILGQVLEGAEVVFQSNMERRQGFLHLQEYKGEADVAYLSKIPLQALYVPTYPCALQKRLGGWVDGGKWVCFTRYEGEDDPVVVSIGSHGDTSFEELIYKNLGVSTSTVDFSLSPEEAQRVSSLEFVKFYPVGLYGSDPGYHRPATEGVKWVNVFQLMDLVDATFIDILKMDCEQCERGVFLDMKSKFTRDNVPFGQILVEFHLPSMHWSTIQAVAILEGLGYRLFNSEINRFDKVYEHAHYELAFIHESLVVPRTSSA